MCGLVTGNVEGIVYVYIYKLYIYTFNLQINIYTYIYINKCFDHNIEPLTAGAMKGIRNNYDRNL
jgi:hypothetical protein